MLFHEAIKFLRGNPEKVLQYKGEYFIYKLSVIETINGGFIGFEVYNTSDGSQIKTAKIESFVDIYEDEFFEVPEPMFYIRVKNPPEIFKSALSWGEYVNYIEETNSLFISDNNNNVDGYICKFTASEVEYLLDNSLSDTRQYLVLEEVVEE